MGFRFRRSIKLFPGFRVNISKTGISESIGRPGATINFRGDRTKATVGAPGTGLSYSKQSRGGSLGLILAAILAIIVLVAIFK